MLVDGGEKTKVGFKFEGETKIRIAKKTGAEIKSKAEKK